MLVIFYGNFLLQLLFEPSFKVKTQNHLL